MQQVKTRKKTARKKTRTIKSRPRIEPAAIYNRSEAAEAVGVSQITLFRAYDSGNLKGYRVGARISHSGQQLLDWLEAGGKTGRTVEDVRRESAEK